MAMPLDRSTANAFSSLSGMLKCAASFVALNSMTKNLRHAGRQVRQSRGAS